MAELLFLGLKVKLFVDIDVRAYEDGVVLPHPDHILGVSAQVEKRLLECRKTALQPLDEVNLHNLGKLQGQGVGVAVSTATV